MSTRERKLRFLRDGGEYVLRDAVMSAFIRHGPDWLTDEQLADMVRENVRDWRSRARRNREHCAHYAARQRRENVA